MIKILIVERYDMVGSLSDKYEAIADELKVPIKIDAITYVKSTEDVPKEYDIYAIHIGLINLNKLRKLRIENPLSYIITRDTLLVREASTPEMRASSNVWCGEYKSDQCRQALEKVSKLEVHTAC